jgi:hypothetical protein
MGTAFVLTADQTAAIEGWQAERAELEKVISDAQKRLLEVNKRLDAAAVLSGAAAPHVIGLFGDEDEAGSEEGENLTSAIEEIANGSPVPVSKGDLKKLLAKQGFAASRLANYFYTAIHRLKRKGKITVRSDGSIWKAPPKS